MDDNATAPATRNSRGNTPIFYQRRRYNDRVRTPLARDTSAEIEERQLAAWRDMSAAQKADLIAGLTSAAREMAAAGLRHRHPGASEREIFLRLAILNLGAELARRAYPEIEHLKLL